MNIGRSLDFSFQNHLQNIYYASEAVDETEIRRMLSQFEQLSIALNHIKPLLFVIDYTKSQYLVMTEASQLIISYDPRDFLDGGIPMLLELFQKDDFKVYNEKLFTANMRFLKNSPQEEHHQYVFSYTYRVRHRSGHYVPILQRGSYITSKETGLPLYSLGMVMDITPFKKDHVIYHTIEKTEKVSHQMQKHIVESNYFFPYEEDTLLTRQERNILETMAEGWSSKQIAVKFRISENTVSNHRKNMLKKTNTKNVAELVAFAIRHQII